jgi:hypothetical protein
LVAAFGDEPLGAFDFLRKRAYRQPGFGDGVDQFLSDRLGSPHSFTRMAAWKAACSKAQAGRAQREVPGLGDEYECVQRPDSDGQ